MDIGLARWRGGPCLVRAGARLYLVYEQTGNHQMSEMHRSRVLIIGAGPAGYTAAIYAARANLQPILVPALQPGGQMTITTDVENYPGFAEVIQGPWLMEQMQAQAEHVGTEDHSSTSSSSVDLARRPFVAPGDCGDIYHRRYRDHRHRRAGALARPAERGDLSRVRRFGLRDLRRVLLPRQGRVVVVGGGNTAVEEAIYLTNHAQQGDA